MNALLRFLTSSTYFEPHGFIIRKTACTGYTPFWYGMFFMHLYTQSSRWKSVFEHTLPPAFRWFMLHNFIKMHEAKT